MVWIHFISAQSHHPTRWKILFWEAAGASIHGPCSIFRSDRKSAEISSSLRSSSIGIGPTFLPRASLALWLALSRSSLAKKSHSYLSNTHRDHIIKPLSPKNFGLFPPSFRQDVLFNMSCPACWNMNKTSLFFLISDSTRFAHTWKQLRNCRSRSKSACQGTSVSDI